MKTSLRILVAVKSEGLTRVIFHLLGNLQNVDVFCTVADPARIVHYAERVLPHLVIANSCCVNSRETINTIRNASPGVKLILTLWSDAPQSIDHACGEDARLSEDALVEQLVPTVLRLSAPAELKHASRSAKRGS